MESQFSQSLFSMLFTLEFGLFSYIYLTFLIFLERFIIPLLTIECFCVLFWEDNFDCTHWYALGYNRSAISRSCGIDCAWIIETGTHWKDFLEETKRSFKTFLKLKPGTEQMKLFIEEVFNITKGSSTSNSCHT